MRGEIMDSMKMAFAAVLLLAFAGVGFMLLSGSGTGGTPATSGAYGMPIDESIPVATGSQQQLPSGQQLQVVRVHASSSGYDNPSPVVNAGQAVRLDFSADSSAGCGRQLILDGVGTSVNLVSRNGQTVSATFTPPSPGQYRFHCGMNMFRGVLTAK
jgi:hypothetical protein